MRQIQPIPATMKLAPTLARRVFQIREWRNMTVKDVASICRFPEQRIEDIESGFETWLSSSERQLLARALSVEPMILQEVETRTFSGHSADSQMLNKATAEQISNAILNGAKQLECPDCGSTLRCSIQEGRDMEDKPVKMAKAFCQKCPFVLR